MKILRSPSIVLLFLLMNTGMVQAENAPPKDSAICLDHVSVSSSPLKIVYGKDIGGSVAAIVRNFGPGTVMTDLDKLEIPVGGETLLVQRRRSSGEDSITVLSLSTEEGTHACVDIQYLFDGSPSTTKQ